jgi:hypothetical protein
VVEWHFETGGWLVVGFEHCAGPHADLSPGSPTSTCSAKR